MVYIHSWQDYQDAAEALYSKSPKTTRYCVKWKSSEGKLILKITDNTTCIKFKTYSSIFLNRFEALNLSLMKRMQNARQVPASVPLIPHQQPLPPTGPKATTEETPVASPASGITPSAGGPATGGVKKKKQKKR